MNLYHGFQNISCKWYNVSFVNSKDIAFQKLVPGKHLVIHLLDSQQARAYRDDINQCIIFFYWGIQALGNRLDATAVSSSWHSSLCITPFPGYRFFSSGVCLFLCLVSLQPNLVCKKRYFSLYRILSFICCQGLTHRKGRWLVLAS